MTSEPTSLIPFTHMARDMARAVGMEANPTVERLRETFLEEFGALPSPEVVAFFEKEVLRKKTPGDSSPTLADATAVRDAAPPMPRAPRAPRRVNLISSRVSPVLRQTQGDAPPPAKPPEKKAKKTVPVEPKLALSLPEQKEGLTETVATSANPTLAKFYAAFYQEFGEAPARGLLLAFHAQALARAKRVEPILEEEPEFEEGDTTGKVLAAEGESLMAAVLAGSSPTPALFMDEYQKLHGTLPPKELVGAFCRRLREQRQGPAPGDTLSGGEKEESPGAGLDKMREDLVRSVLAQPKPTRALLTEVFLEEFGTPPPREAVTMFMDALARRGAE
jgi:hypothetical protein